MRVIAAIMTAGARSKILDHVGLGSDPPKGQFLTREEFVYEGFH